MEPSNKTAVYYETAAYARENGELELFRLSHRTNIACKNDIQDAISRHFDGMRLDKETAKEVLDQYGAERVSIVLAATVQYKSCDGRFSSSNKDWAFSVHLPEGQSASGFGSQRNPGAPESCCEERNGSESCSRCEGSKTKDA